MNTSSLWTNVAIVSICIFGLLRGRVKFLIMNVRSMLNSCKNNFYSIFLFSFFGTCSHCYCTALLPYLTLLSVQEKLKFLAKNQMSQFLVFWSPSCWKEQDLQTDTALVRSRGLGSRWKCMHSNICRFRYLQRFREQNPCR